MAPGPEGPPPAANLARTDETHPDMRPPAVHQVLRRIPISWWGSRLVLLSTIALLPGCGRGPDSGLRVVRGGDLPREGLTFGGVAMDCDGDGWPDLLVSRHGAEPEVYLNRGGLRFVRAADEVRLPGELGDQHGAAACDFDRDGDDDVYVTTGAERGQAFSWKSLWRQARAGRFEDATGRDPVAGDPIGRGRGALWLDLDRDRRPELLLINYHSQARLLQMADGAWRDATDRLPTPPAVPLWQPGQPPPSPEERQRSTWVHAAVAADLDGDGLTDLLTMGRPGWTGAWRNVGGSRLRDVTCPWGLAAAFFPEVPAHAAVGDVDEDGDLDLVLAYRPEQNESRAVPGKLQVWLQGRQEGGVLFQPAEFGDERPAQEAVIEAVLLADLDNDGHLDLYALRRGQTGGPAADLWLLGDGGGRFRPAPGTGGIGGDRGLAESIWAEDLDRDGDLDIVRFAGGGVEPRNGAGIELLENRAPGRGLVLELAGRRGPPHGMGARVELELPGGGTLLREVQALAMPHSGSVPPVHFGVGDRRGPLTVRVRWPGGAVQEVVVPESGRAYRLQDEGGALAVLAPRWRKGGGP